MSTPAPSLRPAADERTVRDEVAIDANGKPIANVRIRGDCRTAVVLHFHGGVFTGGSLDSGADVARTLADAGAAVVSIEYPLAPAHPFPAAVEAGYATLEWLSRQRRKIAAPRVPIFVAGEEAGGNLAASVAMIARDRNGPEIAGQILMSPMLDSCVGTASQREASAGPVGCPCADGWRAYLQRASDALHPYAVPGLSMRLGGLPPTLLITAADDPLRDETLAYAQRLRDAGILVHAPVVDAPTGWPLSYADNAGAPWADRLRGLIAPFILDADGCCRSESQRQTTLPTSESLTRD